MLQRLSIILYNRYRVYLRRRGGPAGELAGEVAAGEIVRGLDGRSTPVRKRTGAVIVAGIVCAGCSIWGGVAVQDHRQEARIEAQLTEASAEYDVLAYAYRAAWEAEMRERGEAPPAEVRGLALMRYMSEHPPESPEVLALKAKRDGAWGKMEAIYDAKARG